MKRGLLMMGETGTSSLKRTAYEYALLISFIGSLPVGTLNVSITGLVVDGHAGAAFLFGLGALLVEVCMVRVALVVVKKLAGLGFLLRWARVIGFVVLLLLGCSSLVTAWHVWHLRGTGATGMTGETVIPYAGYAPFVAGLVLSLLNPLHLPFWMGWTAVLRGKGLLVDNRRAYNLFVMAIGIGTGLAFLLYGYLGHLLILFFLMNQALIHGLTGVALLGTGVVQGWKIFARR